MLLCRRHHASRTGGLDPRLGSDNDDITTFSRAWTGFDLSPWRGNIESPQGAQSTNYIDPLHVTGAHRDAFPKLCLLYTSPSPRDRQKSRMPSSA